MGNPIVRLDIPRSVLSYEDRHYLILIVVNIHGYFTVGAHKQGRKNNTVELAETAVKNV